MLTCNPSFLHFSTWAVWLLRAHWQTSWLLMWACRKTPQVALYFILLHLFIFYLCITNSKCGSPQTGEACWWTIHPASKQRSEGEKVRVGDDLILVSVSSERYLVTIILFTCILNDNLSSVNLTKIMLFSASVLRQRWLDGRCLLHANTVDHDPSDVRMRASRRFAICFLLNRTVGFVQEPLHAHIATWFFSSRFSDWRVCAQAVPWSHGRMFGNPRSWPRRWPAQVTNKPFCQ